MKKMGGVGYELWSESDGFFYDTLCYPDGSYHKFRVRSLVGLIPLYAIERLEERWMESFPEFSPRCALVPGASAGSGAALCQHGPER